MELSLPEGIHLLHMPVAWVPRVVSGRYWIHRKCLLSVVTKDEYIKLSIKGVSSLSLHVLSRGCVNFVWNAVERIPALGVMLDMLHFLVSFHIYVSRVL